jgi:hypothetical protein
MTYVSLLRDAAGVRDGCAVRDGDADTRSAGLGPETKLAIGTVLKFTVSVDADALEIADPTATAAAAGDNDASKAAAQVVPTASRHVAAIGPGSAGTAAALQGVTATVSRSPDLSDTDPRDGAVVSRGGGGAKDTTRHQQASTVDHVISVTVQRSGKHVLTARLHGVCLPGFPIAFDVPEGWISSEVVDGAGVTWTAKGEGLSQARTGESAKFRVKAEGGGGGGGAAPPVVTIVPRTPVRIVAARTAGAFDVTFAALVPGEFSISVALSTGEVFSGSPFLGTAHVGRPSSRASLLFFPTEAQRAAGQHRRALASDSAALAARSKVAPAAATCATIAMTDIFRNLLTATPVPATMAAMPGQQPAAGGGAAGSKRREPVALLEVVPVAALAAAGNGPSADPLRTGDLSDRADGTVDMVFNAPEQPGEYAVRAWLSLGEMDKMKMLSSFAGLANVFKECGPGFEAEAAAFDDRQARTLASIVVRGDKTLLPVLAADGTDHATLIVE